MKKIIATAVLMGSILAGMLGQQPLRAQACRDEEAMVGDYQKSLTELVGMVKKESLADFDRAYHQKTCLTKLTLCLSMVNGVVSCLEKAAQDTTATKEQVETYRVKRESYTKLKNKIEEDRKALKAAEAPKEAKAVIEKFDLSN